MGWAINMALCGNMICCNRHLTVVLIMHSRCDYLRKQFDGGVQLLDRARVAVPYRGLRAPRGLQLSSWSP